MKSSILLFLIFVTANLGVAAQTARKTVTNADLEKHRQTRLKSEADYRANYEKLGMPSPEELEKREAERRAWHEEFSRNKALENQQTESYFQEQARDLKAELLNVQAQINYLRGEINRMPNQKPLLLGSSAGRVYSTGTLPYGYNQLNGFYRPQTPGRPINAPNPRTPINNPRTAQRSRVRTPNPNYRTGINIIPAPGVVNRQRRGGFYNRTPYLYGGGYGLSYDGDTNSYERDDLVSRLRQLEQAKAGLLAEFGALQEEARRAGVRID